MKKKKNSINLLLTQISLPHSLRLQSESEPFRLVHLACVLCLVLCIALCYAMPMHKMRPHGTTSVASVFRCLCSSISNRAILQCILFFDRVVKVVASAPCITFDMCIMPCISFHPLIPFRWLGVYLFAVVVHYVFV